MSSANLPSIRRVTHGSINDVRVEGTNIDMHRMSNTPSSPTRISAALNRQMMYQTITRSPTDKSEMAQGHPNKPRTTAIPKPCHDQSLVQLVGYPFWLLNTDPYPYSFDIPSYCRLLSPGINQSFISSVVACCCLILTHTEIGRPIITIYHH